MGSSATAFTWGGEDMGPSSWTNWSKELKYPLEQESQVSELAIMLCSYLLSLYPSGEKGGEYLIVSCKMEWFLAEGLKKPHNISITLRCFLRKTNYHHVKKIIYLNSSRKEYSNYLVASEKGERQMSTLQFFSCIQKKKKYDGGQVFLLLGSCSYFTEMWLSCLKEIVVKSKKEQKVRRYFLPAWNINMSKHWATKIFFISKILIGFCMTFNKTFPLPIA